MCRLYQTEAKMFTSTANTGWKTGRIEAKTNAQTVCHRNFPFFPCSIQRSLCNANIYHPNFYGLQVADPIRSSSNHFKYYGQFGRFGIHLFGSIRWKASFVFISGIRNILVFIDHFFVRIHCFTKWLHFIQSSKFVSFGKSKPRLHSRNLSISLEFFFVLRLSRHAMDSFVRTIFFQVSNFY